mgnify:CR=1 FL=1
MLLPSLEGIAATLGRGLAAKCGASNLFGATEAVSLILRRWLLAQDYPRSILLGRHGDVVDYGGDGKVVIIAGQLAIEVARFTDLWADDEVVDSKLKPSVEAIAMVLWMWEAAKCQAYLLRHFIAEVSDNPDYLLLTELPPHVRVDDPRQRWSRKK